MKRKISLIFIALICIAFVSNAQSRGDFRAGAGLGFAASPFGGDGTIGFGANIEYLFKSDMSGSLEYYSFTKDSFTTNVLDINFRYYFVTGSTQVYGNAGLSNVGGDPDSTLGLNLGAGAIFPLANSFGISTALNYNLAKPDGAQDPFGFGLKAGIMYTF